MSIIQEIFKHRIHEEVCSKTEQGLSEQIYAVANKAKCFGKDSEQMENLFFEAGSCGQRAGFAEGFKTAVALMAECFD